MANASPNLRSTSLRSRAESSTGSLQRASGLSFLGLRRIRRSAAEAAQASGDEAVERVDRGGRQAAEMRGQLALGAAAPGHRGIGPVPEFLVVDPDHDVDIQVGAYLERAGIGLDQEAAQAPIARDVDFAVELDLDLGQGAAPVAPPLRLLKADDLKARHVGPTTLVVDPSRLTRQWIIFC